MTDVTPKNADPVRIALAGLGGHGRTIQHAVAHTPGLDVLAVYDPSREEAELAAERFGCPIVPSYDALLAVDRLEAVSLASPNHVHRAQVEAAVAAGLDVFVEKPIANTVADGRAMTEDAEAAGHVLMVGHNMRFGRAVRLAHDMLEAGRIGEVVTVEVHFSSDTGLSLGPDSWRLRPDQCPLLPMMQLGIHGVDLVHYLVGRITSVFAQARAVTTRDGVVDSITSAFTTSDGPHGTLVSNYCSPVRFEYRIAGTAGTLVGTPHTLTVEPRDQVEAELHDFSDTPFASYNHQMAAFARAVRARTTPETDGWAGLQALAVVEAMSTSVAEHAPVSVPDLHSKTAPMNHDR